MITRRGFLRTALCAAGALASATAVGKVGAHEPDMVHGTLVTGPDPATFVYVGFQSNGFVVIDKEPFIGPERLLAIPHAEIPEYDPRRGYVIIFSPPSVGMLLPPDEWTVPMLRAHYLYALGQRTPDKPLDANHLSAQFMPDDLNAIFGGVLLNGYSVVHINESYDGPNGWVVQAELGANGQPFVFRDATREGIRKRILTGDVTHWANGERIIPGAYTGMLP